MDIVLAVVLIDAMIVTIVDAIFYKKYSAVSRAVRISAASIVLLIVLMVTLS